MALTATTTYVSEATTAAASSATGKFGGTAIQYSGNDEGYTTDLQYYYSTDNLTFSSYTAASSTNERLVSLVNLSDSVALLADETYYIKAGATQELAGTVYGATYPRKTSAVAPSVSTNTSTTTGSTTATVSYEYYPNTYESTCSAQIQYRVPGGDWTNAGTANTSTGYTLATESENLTGLTASTQYQTRLVITRSTVTDASYTSSTYTFTTYATPPSVTTDSPTNVATTQITANGTLTIGGGTGVQVYFRYGPAGVLPLLSTTTPADATASGAFSAIVSGLDASTDYDIRASASYVTPVDGNSPVGGSTVTFTTTTTDSVAVQATYEDHMQTQEVDAVYGAQTIVPFVLRLPSASSSNELYSGDAPSAAADVNMWQTTGTTTTDIGVGAGVTISKVAGTLANTALYTILIAAADMDADYIDVVIHDATASEEFRDHHIRIRTKQSLGSIVVNASNNTNTTAVTYTGVGSGHGLSCVGGATGKDIDGVLGQHVMTWGLNNATSTDATHCDLTDCIGVSSTDDVYNGCLVAIVGGTGIGQCREIRDYVGATNAAQVDTWKTNPNATSMLIVIPGPQVWSSSPGVELAAMPTAASGYGALLQFLFQRFAYKRYQDATQQIMYKADNTTAIATASFEDNSTDQTIGAST